MQNNEHQNCNKVLDEEVFYRDLKSIYMQLRKSMAILHSIANELNINLKECDNHIQKNNQ